MQSSFDVSTASQTIDGTYATYRCTHAAAGTTLTLSTTNWPIGERRRVTKENTSANTITFVPPAGGTINGAAADATLVAPGSIRASATNLGDMEWTVQRVASNTWRVSGGEVRYDSNGNASIVGEASAFKVGSTNNGTAADNAIRVGANTRGLSYDATKGLMLCVDSVERAHLRTDGVFEIRSGVGGGTAVLRLTTTAGDVQVFAYNTTPEGAITASPGDKCFDYTNGREYLKRTGTGNTGWVQIERSDSAAWTPTPTAVSNLDSVTLVAADYLRVGDRAEVWGEFNVDPTAAGPASFRVTLPVTSAFGATSDAAGGAFGSEITFGRCSADATNDAITVSFTATGTTSTVIRILCGYRVL